MGLLQQPSSLETVARTRQPAKVIVKRNRLATKVMCVWWNFEGVIHWKYVPNRRAANADLYSQQQERAHAILKRRYPTLVNRERFILQQDNARLHTASATIIKIQEMGGIELLPHPAYSPDLAPSDYHLFQSMAHF